MTLCGQPDIDTVVPPSAEASVTYMQGALGPFLAEAIAAYSSADEARRAFRAFAEMVDGCESFEETDEDGTTIKYMVTPLAFDELAEDQVALRLNFQAEGVTGAFDLVCVRIGATVAQIAGGSVLTILGGGQLAMGDLESFAATATDRLGQAA
ncbi:MAG: hypothetical protein KatS3mg009_2855 [Acidimicrobiia bacterium]|nr:MAG: hypothetical protein KatS3mg009_2855 [Acidimicrobiia bacterium]